MLHSILKFPTFFPDKNLCLSPTQTPISQSVPNKVFHHANATPMKSTVFYVFVYCSFVKIQKSICLFVCSIYTLVLRINNLR